MIWIILAIGGIAALVVFVIWKRKRNAVNTVLKNLPITLPDTKEFRFYHDTPGYPIISSVVPVPIEAQGMLAAGVQKMLDCTDDLNWQYARSMQDFVVLLIPPDTRNLDGSPALFVNGIQSAGTCIGIYGDGFNPPCIVLPHQAPDWRFLDYLKASARHEAEHIGEAANGIPHHEGGHPFYPDAEGN